MTERMACPECENEFDAEKKKCPECGYRPYLDAKIALSGVGFLLFIIVFLMMGGAVLILFAWEFVTSWSGLFFDVVFNMLAG